MARISRGTTALGEEILDDAVFQRMKRDDDETGAWLKHVLGGGEPAHKFGKLFVDEDTQRLKRACGRMDRAVVCTHDPRDNVRERARGADNVVVAGFDNRARDRPRMPLLAERGDDGGEIAFAGASDDVSRARAVAPHPHVERAVEPERKTALRLVELHRRHAEIENDTIDRGIAGD